MILDQENMHTKIRLLKRLPGGGFELIPFDDHNSPPYAILSHTWDDGQEVTYHDLMHGTGEGRRGFEKIQFCGQQAERDGLQYFWVDTCCINKSDKLEERTAINSMFRWYRKASRCYVYLSDVSTTKQKASNQLSKFIWEWVFWASRWFTLTKQKPSNQCAESTWELEFRVSKWFTRGWTLQELLAPISIDFFSSDGKHLGDKASLEQQICEITGIPKSALQGCHLSQFSDKERFYWGQYRQTKIEEDKVYSLLGIFGVEMDLDYGEGRLSALNRLREEINKLNMCLQDLHSTDPSDDKRRIEDAKGTLLKDSYHWILENSYYQQWRDDQCSHLLWIKGDPGKGKTMLLCGIINELKKSMTETALLSYFFCQATDSRISNATAVLRGLIYVLVSQQPSLTSHIRKKYDQAGKTLFEDANAWFALSDIFNNILQDPSLNTTYLIIDALDECVTDLPKLLNFLVQMSAGFSHIKWIVSSRNRPDITEQLQGAGHRAALSLELNAESISTAVSMFIQHKVSQLTEKKVYNSETQAAVRKHLSSNADNTFLWVALVCQHLEKIQRWETVAKLNKFPPGLDLLYERMLEQMYASDYADLCKRILALIAVAYRPITLKELASLIELPEGIPNNLESIKGVTSYCGSFLTIPEDTIYFVHQSAKDFLFKPADKDCLNDHQDRLQGGVVKGHMEIVRSSIAAMSSPEQDIFRLGRWNLESKIIAPLETDQLVSMQYLCVYWLNHLHGVLNATTTETSKDLCDTAFSFLKEHFLHWLESLGVLHQLSAGIISIRELLSILKLRFESESELVGFLKDAEKFTVSYSPIIDRAPLQTYGAALTFCPTECKMKEWFWGKQQLPLIKSVKGIKDNWDSLLQTLEGHTGSVCAVAFSPDGKLIVSASSDQTVRLWDSATGTAQGEPLKGHTGWVWAVAFSPDGKLIASASDDQTVRLWDSATGTAQGELQTNVVVQMLHFSTDGQAIDTDRGRLDIRTLSLRDVSVPSTSGGELFVDREWIIQGTEKVLWLPPDYRAICAAVHGRFLAMGHASGCVSIIEIEIEIEESSTSPPTTC